MMLMCIAYVYVNYCECGSLRQSEDTYEDMIFVVRQLMEKTREHDDTLFMMFVDLMKPGEVLCGFYNAKHYIHLSHEWIQAGVRMRSSVDNCLNSLRQGYMMESNGDQIVVRLVRLM